MTTKDKCELINRLLSEGVIKPPSKYITIINYTPYSPDFLLVKYLIDKDISDKDLSITMATMNTYNRIIENIFDIAISSTMGFKCKNYYVIRNKMRNH